MTREDLSSTAVTEGIRITVRSNYVAERSVALAEHYTFSYTVRIRNEGPQTAKLRSRHWLVTDATGSVEEVRGAGVVGEQPVLRPGEEFTYTSRAVLKTPRGWMCGTFQMQRPNGRVFDATIAPFVLAQPYSLN